MENIWYKLFHSLICNLGNQWNASFWVKCIHLVGFYYSRLNFINAHIFFRFRPWKSRTCYIVHDDERTRILHLDFVPIKILTFLKNAFKNPDWMKFNFEFLLLENGICKIILSFFCFAFLFFVHFLIYSLIYNAQKWVVLPMTIWNKVEVSIFIFVFKSNVRIAVIENTVMLHHNHWQDTFHLTAYIIKRWHLYSWRKMN